MPDSDTRPLRRPRRRLRALAGACALVGAFALGAPASAGAYEEHFCQYVTLTPGMNCYASNRHTLQTVKAWSVGSTDRVCAASFTAPWGSQNSDWRCDYGYVIKSLGGRVDGVGAIHNGDPQTFIGYGIQEF